ncbi:MAG: xanthine dehydrogenase family protein [Deltaproteobacteria bacterium]|nr:xanthine dehydrogenase family protein [Deltaproteobacteria bacterium]
MTDEIIQEPAGKRAYRRKEAARLVRGAGCYVDDLQFPDTAYAAFVRSSAARATITRLDLSPARACPGVLAVVSSLDITGEIRPSRGPQGPLANLFAYPLVRGSVCYVGEPVAVVVAESRYQAQDGADAIVVDYDLLPPILDPETALQPEAARVFDDLASNIVQEVHIGGDGVEQAFSQADHVISERFRTQRLAACPLEPRACAAVFDAATGRYTLWSSTVTIHAVRLQVAESLGVAENRVRVIAPDVGGSFGGKVHPYPEEILLAYLAKRLSRPVKWAETRIEHLTNVRQGRDQIHYVQAAVRNDGRVLALKSKIIADFGATTRFINSLPAAALYSTGAYDIQCHQVDAFGVLTNKTPQGPVRGIGKADAAYVIERLMDIIARRLDMDPAEVRMKNFVREDAFPYRTATGSLLDSGRYATCLRKALDLAGYEELRRQQGELRKKGVLRGIGMCLVIEPTSAARPGQGGAYGACRVRMEPSGSVSAFPAYGHQGQGHQTAIARIIADRLGILPDEIEVFAGDTAASPYGPAAISSRSAVILMPAVHVAAMNLREKILRIAGHVLEIDPGDLRLERGMVRAAGAPERALQLREIARIAYADVYRLPPGLEPGLEVTGYFSAPNITWTPDEKGRRNEFVAVPYEATVAVVDVDGTTGGMQIAKYVTVHDCGTRLVPEIVETQHYGSIAQGLGEALFEEMRYDENGQPLNSTFMDYLLPTVNDIPPVETDHLVTPSPFTPLGAKGGGETGTLSPPAALGNAIEDALAPLKVRVKERPYTSDRLWKAMNEEAS